MSRRCITHDQFLAECREKHGDMARHWKFVCPACGTVQSADDFLNSGKFTAGSGEVNQVLGFSCIGRYTGQGDEGITAKNAGKPWDKGCNWTLGGLLQIHDLEVEFEGKKIPHFEIAPASAKEEGKK